LKSSRKQNPKEHHKQRKKEQERKDERQLKAKCSHESTIMNNE